MPILLDTHTWIWWFTEDPRLSRPARRAIDKAQAADALWLSLISVWEVARKTEKRQLVPDRPLDDWLDLATTRPGLHLAELTRTFSRRVAACLHRSMATPPIKSSWPPRAIATRSS